MARRILGRSRSTRQVDTITNPVLMDTDALPRNVLKEIDHGASHSRPVRQVLKSGQGHGTPEKPPLKERTEVPAHGFDFQITVPPAEDVLSSTGADPEVDETMIGIALGSPRLLESQNPMSQKQQSPPSTVPQHEISPQLQRKSSKWRKIGGLFKAKSPMAANVDKPFYQVRADTEWLLQGSSHSVDYRSRQVAGPSPAPIENTEVWPCLGVEAEAKTDKRVHESKTSGPLLQIEFPNVEMERYSVMFGGLLDRRSKTLEDIAIPSKEVSRPLGLPRRRTTSPTRSRSPNFTLFPATPTSEASKILGTQNLPQAPDQFCRTQTPQGETRQDSRSAGQGHGTVTGQSTHSTQTFHQPKNSVASFLSSTSIGSDDEMLLIHKMDPVRSYVDVKEPEWEMIKKRATEQVDQNPTRALTVNTREVRSESFSSGSTSTSSPILSPLSPRKTSHRKDIHGVSESPPSPIILPSAEDPIPTVEVSIARSVSVSKGKKQVLVPVRPRPSQLGSNERLVPRQVKTPKVTDGQLGHRPGFSQDVRIEMA